VVTAQGDTSLEYCGTAMRYEDDRSALLSQLATSIAVFSFVWGAFESVTSIVDPPSIPKTERKDDNNQPVARVVYALRSLKPDGVYHCRLAQIRHLMTVMPEFSLPVGLGAVAVAKGG